jgi:hypothetical protein
MSPTAAPKEAVRGRASPMHIWTDQVVAGVGPGAGFSPSPEDAEWAARELGDFDAAEVPDEESDRAAELAREVERHERGVRVW